MPTPALLQNTISERDFQKQVIELAQLLGYRVAHFRTAQNSKGIYRTPVAADGKGYPDLTLVGNGRILWVELKAERGRLRPEQEQWIQALSDCGGECHVWRPSDFDEIVRILQNGS